MLATEQTWRDQRLMHRIFGVTGFLLLASTIWMLYADHDREWKGYQDNARRMDLTYNEWLQLQYRTDEAVRSHERLRSDLLEAQSQDIADDLLDEFENADDETKRLFERNGIPELRVRLHVAVAAVGKSSADLAKMLAQQKAQTEAQQKAQTEALQKAQTEAQQQAAVQALQQAKLQAQQQAAAIHAEVVAALNAVVTEVRFHETNKLDERKGASGELDAAKAELDLAVRDDLPNQAEYQGPVDELKKDLDKLTAEYQAIADRRKKLQSIVRTITAGSDEKAKLIETNHGEFKNLQTAFHDRSMNYFTSQFPWLGKKRLTLPVLDAFNSPRKIDNLWSDGNTINLNFGYTRRFDRCTTCHQAIEKSLPGKADQPLFVTGRTIRLLLPTPTADEVESAGKEYEKLQQLGESGFDQDHWLLHKLYGFLLANDGLANANDVSVSLVMPGSLAARAELASGDNTPRTGAELRDAVAKQPSGGGQEPEKAGLALGDAIRAVAGSTTQTPEKVLRQLLVSAEFGKPVELVVRRGFDQPYSSHPRLDLFVGSLSPHKLSTFACTACHEGQGSATQFKWASHTPDSVRQREDWARDHGWFDNSHWIYPMYSKRFAESSCLKCHHEVVDLQPSERFPDPPAPKLIQGYNLLRKYGCYGCHEINGYDGPNKRLGPDLRAEPNFYGAALQLKALLQAGPSPTWPTLTADEQKFVQQVAEHPENDHARHRLVEMLATDAASKEPRFTASIQKLVGALKDVEIAGVMTKPGPSLRYAAHKLDEKFLFDWIREPKHFRPSTRMPQFFGFRAHLTDEKSQQLADDFEPVEIAGMLTYLRQRSQNFEYLPRLEVQEPQTESEAEKIAGRATRGKVLFEQRGCLACHSHGDFPDVKGYRPAGEIVQGPDLTGLGSKFDPQRNPRGADWLYTWIKQPSRYHARTVMPDLFLNPIAARDADGNVTSTTDPAADIVAYLLQSTNPDWKPKGSSADGKGPNLDALVLVNLEEAFFKETAAKYAERGIPAAMRSELKGPERELVVEGDRSEPLSEQQKLLYIGAKAIGKHGCFGCHDIPGFEDAKPIGTGLADWGRKDPSKLAFEHITHYLDHQDHAASKDHVQHHTEAEPREKTPDFYRNHISAGHREGFLWQKLTEPRSYDYMKSENKRYNEWLRMPKFPFDPDEREALMTFVLGLVGEPPTAKYVYKPDAQTAALIEGRRVLEKFNCAGCHLLEPEKWRVGVAEGEINPQPVPLLQQFLTPHFSPSEIEDSTKTDRRGLFTTSFTGMPSIDDADARPKVNDQEGDAIDKSQSYNPRKVVYPFDLWTPTTLEGRVYRAGVVPVNVPAHRIDQRYPAKGGVLARYLLPQVTKLEKLVNPAAKGSESWAWVPPPLVGQGRKAQSQWMHDFLLNPYPIRPAVVLRMPRFTMTSAEATALAKYFATVDQVPFPVEPTERRLASYLASAEQAYHDTGPEPAVPESAAASTRFDDALKIVVNQNYCVKCHAVGDFEPKGADRAKAPNLARVHERLRPGYVREWIANPKQILPYTAMPLNIPYVPTDSKFYGGVDQKLYHGTSLEQIDGLVDLLMNFDNFSKSKNLITPIVPKEAPKPEPTADGTEAKPAS